MLAYKTLAAARDNGMFSLDIVTLGEAKALLRKVRVEHGFLSRDVPLLTRGDDNLKLGKSLLPTVGLSLAPATESGHNVCPFSTPACRAGCLASAGNGSYPSVVRARIMKTDFLVRYPAAFYTLLVHELDRFVAAHPGNPRVRLNVFSDIPWERLLPDEFWSRFTDARFYDYTKDWSRGDACNPLPHNYMLTYSVSERTKDSDIMWMPRTLGSPNVAVVFSTTRSEYLPLTYMGLAVIDGDKSDDRWRDGRGVVVGLRAKGRMRGGHQRDGEDSPVGARGGVDSVGMMVAASEANTAGQQHGSPPRTHGGRHGTTHDEDVPRDRPPHQGACVGRDAPLHDVRRGARHEGDGAQHTHTGGLIMPTFPSGDHDQSTLRVGSEPYRSNGRLMFDMSEPGVHLCTNMKMSVVRELRDHLTKVLGDETPVLVLRRVLYKCRDIGYGVDGGTVVGTWDDTYTDFVGKRKFVPTRDENLPPLYLFDDEIKRDTEVRVQL